MQNSRVHTSHNEEIKPEKNKSITSNKPFGANKHAPTTLKQMPPRLTCHLQDDSRSKYTKSAKTAVKTIITS